MPGELRGNRVVIEDPAESSTLQNKGSYGEALSGGGLSLTLLEAVYLVEAQRLEVRRHGKPVPLGELFRIAGAGQAAATSPTVVA